MKTEEINDCLCSYDIRNPLYADIVGYTLDHTPTQPRRDGCCCDNCFHGKDKLAVALLDARDDIKNLIHAANVVLIDAAMRGNIVKTAYLTRLASAGVEASETINEARTNGDETP